MPPKSLAALSAAAPGTRASAVCAAVLVPAGVDRGGCRCHTRSGGQIIPHHAALRHLVRWARGSNRARDRSRLWPIFVIVVVYPG